MSKKVLMLLTVLSLVAALVGGYVFDQRSKNRAKAAAEKSKETKPKTQKVMSEAERRAYVEKFIKIEDIKFGPDTHIGPDGKPVDTKGLVRVKGSAKNIGDRTVQKANLVLHFQNDKDEVLGSEIQDVLGGNSLSAGKTRAFSFTVRARENFTDRFLIRVK